MQTFLWILIAVLAVFLGGAVTSFFVFKNNPKYLNPVKVAKDKRDLLLKKLITEAKAKGEDIKGLIDKTLAGL